MMSDPTIKSKPSPAIASIMFGLPLDGQKTSENELQLTKIRTHIRKARKIAGNDEPFELVELHPLAIRTAEIYVRVVLRDV